MAKPIVFLGATLVAAALGAVASVLVLSLRPEPEPLPPEPVDVRPTRTRGESRRERRPRHGSTPPAPVEKVFSTDTIEFVLPSGSSLSELISSPDEQVRLETARAILRQGSSALPQVRALRPRGAEGEELARKLALALQKLQLNERHIDWARRPPSVRMEARMNVFRMVLPEALLLVERQEMWSARLDVVRKAVAAGRLNDGELALAELELALVRRETGEIDAAAYAKLVETSFPAASAWVEKLDAKGSVPPARVKRYREQLARLRD